jgi:uncharacterized protein YfiM (DUF2279 family)
MIAVALVLQLAVTTPDSVKLEADAWLGADKFKHAAMSYTVTSFAFAATDNDAAAIATGAAAGILKEIYDRRQSQRFSFRDLVWDAFGIALGYAVFKQTK